MLLLSITFIFKESTNIKVSFNSTHFKTDLSQKICTQSQIISTYININNIQI